MVGLGPACVVLHLCLCCCLHKDDDSSSEDDEDNSWASIATVFAPISLGIVISNDATHHRVSALARHGGMVGAWGVAWGGMGGSPAPLSCMGE